MLCFCCCCFARGSCVRFVAVALLVRLRVCHDNGATGAFAALPELFRTLFVLLLKHQREIVIIVKVIGNAYDRPDLRGCDVQHLRDGKLVESVRNEQLEGLTTATMTTNDDEKVMGGLRAWRSYMAFLLRSKPPQVFLLFLCSGIC